MARVQLASAIQFISQFLRRGPELTDGQLVDCFVSRRDEAAFAALVHRHGPMVLGVCRQVLRDEAAAEDAFQATFLVLARKAGSIRGGQAVGSWLYRVAHRLALRARTHEDQRHQSERRMAMMRQTASLDSQVEQDLGPVLHEEVQRLPEKFQAPVVLCYLEGKTAGRAAEQLGCRESVVRGRLFQARAMLRARLARRGIALSAGGLSATLAAQTAGALPPALAEHTVEAALAFGAGATAGVTAQALALAESMVASLSRSRLTFATLLCLLAGSIGLATGVMSLRAPAQALVAGAAEGESVAAAPAERPKERRPEGTTEEAKAKAVAAGLAWLAQHQAEDGSWSLHAFHRNGKCSCTGTGGDAPIAGAAFGILPFLRAGETHQKGPHAKQIERGLKFLITRQGNDGSFGKKAGMYEHGLATMALCEAYARTADAQLKGPAQRAVDYTVAAQHEAGGWRYQPRIPGDLSVTAWQIQALRWGHLAGLTVPEATWKQANRYLDSVGNADGSGYGYTQPQPSPSMTACGLLCRAYLLDEFVVPENSALPGFEKGTAYLAKLPPKANFRNSYYYYYATNFMNQEVANGADDWNTGMRRVLLASQDWGEDAMHQHQKGSWAPDGDAWGGQIGRLGMTSFALMTLSASDPFIARSTEPAKELKAEEVEQLWAELSGSKGAFRAGQASRTLAVAKQTVPFLKQQLRPIATADPKITARWVADLDSASFEARERATQELEKLGESATTALLRALEDKPPLEARQRIEALMNQLQMMPFSPEQRQSLRAIRVLEQIGTPEAHDMLEKLASGAAGARLTRAAKSSLDRLGRK